MPHKAWRGCYGPIPTADFFYLTQSLLLELNAGVVLHLIFCIAAIVFVAAVESLLCAHGGQNIMVGLAHHPSAAGLLEYVAHFARQDVPTAAPW